MSARKPSRSRPPSEPSPAEPGEGAEPIAEPGNGAVETESETETAIATEEPAQVQLTIKGSDKSARAAAKRFGEGAGPKLPPVVSTPGNEPEEPQDPIAGLLSDGKNMVIVTRQKPRIIKAPDGSDFATNFKIPGRYSCPTSKSEIEELVFNQHGGQKYKCTIHPDTTDGENKILGHFTIEHSDPKCPPFIDGITVNVEEPEPEREIPSGTDPTQRETDPLAQMRAALQRRLERVQMKKEIEELESQINELEGKKKESTMTVPAGESEEVRKLREENARLAAQLAEKKVNDRFDSLENKIAGLADAVKSAAMTKPAASEETSIVKAMMASQEKMFTQSQQHSKDMLALIQEKGKPATSAEGDLDKFLDRVTKLQAVTGTAPGKTGSGRLSALEEKLIDMSFDRLTGGEGGGGDDDDGLDPFESAVKLAIKEFAPIAKTYVDKKMEHENQASGGQPVPKEVIQKIQVEAAQAAARKVQEDLAQQGYQLAQAADGRLVALPIAKGAAKPTVPPRSAGTRVVSETRTQGGVVKKIAIQPDNLSAKPKPAAEPPANPDPRKGDEMPKAGVFPLIGPNKSTINIPFPERPGELKYDRKYAVNFILDGIRSEILQELPQKAQTDEKIESYVIGDAIEYLDDDILNQLENVDTEQALEALLSPWGDAAKISEIKEAGKNDVVASYLRKLVRSIQREWDHEKTAPRQ